MLFPHALSVTTPGSGSADMNDDRMDSRRGFEHCTHSETPPAHGEIYNDYLKKGKLQNSPHALANLLHN
jgi:hypothetical protein